MDITPFSLLHCHVNSYRLIVHQGENLRRNAQPVRRKYGLLIGLPGSNSASNFTGAAYSLLRV
jgi:hypothetical protein